MCTCIGIVYLQLGFSSHLASKPLIEILHRVKETILKLVIIEIKKRKEMEEGSLPQRYQVLF